MPPHLLFQQILLFLKTAVWLLYPGVGACSIEAEVIEWIAGSETLPSLRSLLYYLSCFLKYLTPVFWYFKLPFSLLTRFFSMTFKHVQSPHMKTKEAVLLNRMSSSSYYPTHS